MRPALSRLTRWLASPRLALGLLFALVVLVFLATLVPQGGPATPTVADWATEHPLAETLTRVFGFHSAYTSPIFLACALLLGLSTAVCSWRRTKVAAYRLALVRSMTREQAESLVRRPTFSVELQGDPAAALEAVSAALRDRRALITVGDRYVGGGSSRSGILGSPVFHWALVLIFVVLVGGQLTRAEGLMGVAEGETKPNTQQSYGVIDSGALYRWRPSLPAIGVERIRFDNVVDGIDRGPTPTVVLYGPSGEVLSRGEVYPNNPLKYKSFTVHPNEYGLAAVVSLVTSEGQSLGQTNVLVDFSDTEQGGTSPGTFELTGQSGAASFVATISIPLDKSSEGYRRSVPSNPSAVVSLTSPSGDRLESAETIAVGQSIKLPEGSALRLDDIRYYARLSVVDDGTLPLLFAAFAVALGGLSLSLLGSKYAAAVVVADAGSGERLDVWFRDWRGDASGAARFETLVRDAVRSVDGKEAT